MAKYPIHAHDPYIDRATGVLRNRLGIADQAELDRAEATLALVRSVELIAVARQGAEEAEQSYVDAILKARPRPASGPERNPKRSVIGMLKSLFR